MKSATIPGSVKTIPTSAFYECSGLRSLTLEDGIETIGTAAFCKCTSLVNFTMPRSITRLGNGAFSHISSGGVDATQNGPFYTASGTHIDYTGTKAEWKALQNLDGGPLNFTGYVSMCSYTVTCTDGTLTYNYLGLQSET